MQAGFAQLVLNQLGFYPEGQKQAVVINGTLNRDFRLIDASTGETVYEGKLSEPIPSKNSTYVTRIADFSGFTKPGNYKIVAGLFETPTITIGNNVLQEAAKAALKGYYYQRVSMPWMLNRDKRKNHVMWSKKGLLLHWISLP
ncbi:hypothetical protein FACS1894182_13760 [Bacteroidia bacterium]|nr:hypothetical protein FACS1894182_13760 [Bacteroidia bacterium]